MSSKGRPGRGDSCRRPIRPRAVRSSIFTCFGICSFLVWHLCWWTSSATGISTLVAEPEPGLGEGSCALCYFDLELSAGTKVFVPFSLWAPSQSCLLSSSWNTLWGGSWRRHSGACHRRRANNEEEDRPPNLALVR